MASMTIRFAGALVALAAVAGANQACSSGGSGGAGGGTGGSPTTSSTGGASSSSSTSTGGGTGGTGTGGTSTGGSGGTGGTGGSVPVTTTDKCETATPIALALGTTLQLDGTTAGSANDYTGCDDPAASNTGPDVVVAFTLASEATVDIKLSAAAGSTLKPVIDVRQTCTMNYLCAAYGSTPERMLVALPAGTYYLIVDGAEASSGAFTGTVTATAPKCGDLVLNSGEECDPGAGVANDGCGDPGGADGCKYQAAAAGKDQCPGEAVAITGGTVVLPASQGYATYGFTDNHDGSCAWDVGGRDRIFQVTPSKSGMLTVSVGYETDGTTPTCTKDLFNAGCWDYVLYARTTCATDTTELGCSNGANWSDPEKLTFPVTANTPYFIFVDGNDPDPVISTGPFNLVVTLQ